MGTVYDGTGVVWEKLTYTHLNPTDYPVHSSIQNLKNDGN
jgi:hypothetical protein